tara:strand:- start:531 stop:743 length:213 start_codon:yes stop_codon:yes gene_type:complete
MAVFTAFWICSYTLRKHYNSYEYIITQYGSASSKINLTAISRQLTEKSLAPEWQKIFYREKASSKKTFFI